MDEKRLKKVNSQLFVAIYCLLFFQLTYPLTAVYAGSLAAVPSFVFDFEQHIPFIPWMILPYMSSGLFFFLVPFYCGQKKELLCYARRFTFVTLIAAICFLLFPLRFSFDRPQVENPLFTMFFFFLEKYDSPFNQAPSLHVAYACLFWSVLRWKFNGWKKIILGTWLLMMGLGTLTVYQHQVIDLLTACILVLFSFILFPNAIEQEHNLRQESGQGGRSGYERTCGEGNSEGVNLNSDGERFERRISLTRNQQLANSYYLAGWIFMLLVLLCEGRLLLLILFVWIALLCFAVGYNYLRGNTGFLKDHRGRIPMVKKVFYAPYQLAYWLIWRFFRKKNNPPLMELLPRCYVGPRLNASELVALGLERNLVVFDLAAELEDIKLLGAMEKYYSFPLLDIAEINVHDAHVILGAMLSAYRNLDEHENMVIHCTMGYSRSMLFAILMTRELLSLDLNKAIDQVKSINRYVVLRGYAIQLMKVIVAGRS
ncbi:phosphatase PAP2 family protein [Sphingobacterium thalpophilum]|uniref:phosphatase PAP2 family protein n=1 Tax=Sphingobacterium thalpophilum TaxID=259 RepID=UPI002D7A2BDA|nr:phosphatase PAP2 family protein [Sphingobacterium thalpophilum]